jgi:hypothetical protein
MFVRRQTRSEKTVHSIIQLVGDEVGRVISRRLEIERHIVSYWSSLIAYGPTDHHPLLPADGLLVYVIFCRDAGVAKWQTLRT